jgi:hypothetical protein
MEPLPYFDRWAFDGRRTHAASTDSALDYSDLRNIQVQSHGIRTRRWIPTFAASDESLRLVLLWRAWRYVYSATRQPLPKKFLTNYAALDRLATAKMKKCQRHANHISDAHFQAVHHCGSYMALQSAIAYRSWRLAWDSPTIAVELGVSPVMVRVTLERLRHTAEGLGLPIDISHLSKGMRRKQKVGHAVTSVKHNARKKAQVREPQKKRTPEELQAALENRKAATLEKNFQILRTLTEKNAGVLPGVRWLRVNGFEYAYCSVKRAGRLNLFRRHPRANQFRPSANKKEHHNEESNNQETHSTASELGAQTWRRAADV